MKAIPRETTSLTLQWGVGIGTRRLSETKWWAGSGQGVGPCRPETKWVGAGARIGGGFPKTKNKMGMETSRGQVSSLKIKDREGGQEGEIRS